MLQSREFTNWKGERMSYYEEAKNLNKVKIDRWEKGIPHHPSSLVIMEFISEHDFNDYNDFFCWKYGGDGDNGEFLMYQLDALFETLDILDIQI
jgi:hypothetical protein